MNSGCVIRPRHGIWLYLADMTGAIYQTSERKLMGTDFDDFVEDLQNQIFEETRAAYGDVAFQRWLKPLYMGGINSPDGYGRVTGSCGDTIPPEKLKKPGLLKRFLNWIAKGTDKSNMGKASCPT